MDLRAAPDERFFCRNGLSPKDLWVNFQKKGGVGGNEKKKVK